MNSGNQDKSLKREDELTDVSKLPSSQIDQSLGQRERVKQGGASAEEDFHQGSQPSTMHSLSLENLDDNSLGKVQQGSMSWAEGQLSDRENRLSNKKSTLSPRPAEEMSSSEILHKGWEKATDTIAQGVEVLKRVVMQELPPEQESQGQQGTQDLKQAGQELANKASEKLDQVKEKVESKIQDVKESAQETSNKAAEKTSEAKEQIKQQGESGQFDQAKEKAESKVQDFKQGAQEASSQIKEQEPSTQSSTKHFSSRASEQTNLIRDKEGYKPEEWNPTSEMRDTAREKLGEYKEKFEQKQQNIPSQTSGSETVIKIEHGKEKELGSKPAERVKEIEDLSQQLNKKIEELKKTTEAQPASGDTIIIIQQGGQQSSGTDLSQLRGSEKTLTQKITEKAEDLKEGFKQNLQGSQESQEQQRPKLGKRDEQQWRNQEGESQESQESQGQQRPKLGKRDEQQWKNQQGESQESQESQGEQRPKLGKRDEQQWRNQQGENQPKEQGLTDKISEKAQELKQGFKQGFEKGFGQEGSQPQGEKQMNYQQGESQLNQGGPSMTEKLTSKIQEKAQDVKEVAKSGMENIQKGLENKLPQQQHGHHESEHHLTTESKSFKPSAQGRSLVEKELLKGTEQGGQKQTQSSQQLREEQASFIGDFSHLFKSGQAKQGKSSFLPSSKKSQQNLAKTAPKGENKSAESKRPRQRKPMKAKTQNKGNKGQQGGKKLSSQDALRRQQASFIGDYTHLFKSSEIMKELSRNARQGKSTFLPSSKRFEQNQARTAPSGKGKIATSRRPRQRKPMKSRAQNRNNKGQQNKGRLSAEQKQHMEQISFKGDFTHFFKSLDVMKAVARNARQGKSTFLPSSERFKNNQLHSLRAPDQMVETITYHPRDIRGYQIQYVPKQGVEESKPLTEQIQERVPLIDKIQHGLEGVSQSIQTIKGLFKPGKKGSQENQKSQQKGQETRKFQQRNQGSRRGPQEQKSEKQGDEKIKTEAPPKEMVENITYHPRDIKGYQVEYVPKEELHHYEYKRGNYIVEYVEKGHTENKESESKEKEQTAESKSTEERVPLLDRVKGFFSHGENKAQEGSEQLKDKTQESSEQLKEKTQEGPEQLKNILADQAEVLKTKYRGLQNDQPATGVEESQESSETKGPSLLSRVQGGLHGLTDKLSHGMSSLKSGKEQEKGQEKEQEKVESPREKIYEFKPVPKGQEKQEEKIEDKQSLMSKMSGKLTGGLDTIKGKFTSGKQEESLEETSTEKNQSLLEKIQGKFQGKEKGEEVDKEGFKKVHDGFTETVDELKQEQNAEFHEQLQTVNENPFEPLGTKQAANIDQPLGHTELVGGDLKEMTSDFHPEKKDLIEDQDEKTQGKGLLQKMKEGIFSRFKHEDKENVELSEK